MYMVKMITILPKLLSFGVMPRESPTVLNAEKTSKIASFMLATGCVSRRIKEEKKMTHMAKVMTVKAFMTDSMVRVLRKRLTESLAVIFDFKNPSITPIVLVLIPPPVEPEEAPINISIIKSRTAEKLKEFRSMVLNPAVRGVTT